jgi:hypothetical protein
MAVGAVMPTLLESFKRLTDLLEEPDAIEVLAPLVKREIHYRLLTSEQSGRLRELASVGSQSHLVGRAIDWLKANYASPLRIEELAERASTRASSARRPNVTWSACGPRPLPPAVRSARLPRRAVAWELLRPLSRL